MTARTLLADLPACPDARPVPLSAALRKYAKWRKAGIRLFLDGTESRAIAWAAESRCPGLLVQVCGEAAKDRHLTLLHAPSGLLLGKAALRWPATTAGLEAALVASQGAADLLPAGAWVADDPAAQAGDRAVFVARGRAWAREVGNPSTWYVGASAPLRGWPDEVRRTAEDTARTSGAPVEVRGYADATDRSAGVPMVRYRLEWLDRQPIVTDYRSATAQAADVERLARFYAAGEPGSRADLARLVLGGADIPGAAQGALVALGRWSGCGPTPRGLLWAARHVLAAPDGAFFCADAREVQRRVQAWRRLMGCERIAAFVDLLGTLRANAVAEARAGVPVAPERLHQPTFVPAPPSCAEPLVAAHGPTRHGPDRAWSCLVRRIGPWRGSPLEVVPGSWCCHGALDWAANRARELAADLPAALAAAQRSADAAA